MPDTQVSKANGTTPEPKAPPVSVEALQAQVIELLQRIGNVEAENKSLKAEKAAGVLYEVTQPTVDYPNPTFRVTLPGSKALMGKRAKFLAIAEEVQSGRWMTFVNAHPEVK